MAKETKSQANYVPHAKSQHCDTCVHWRQGTCVEVQGMIAPDATCDYYKAKASAGAKKR